MSQCKAIYYGYVQLIPGIICDGYILDDENATTVMSGRGTSSLLDMDHKTLEAMGGNWPPKTLKPFISEDFTMGGNYVEVSARNSPYCGRKIIVYDTKTIQSLICMYASAYINKGLRKNQMHIGERCVVLSISLVQTALDAAIKEACGFIPEIQKTSRNHYTNALEQLEKFGFESSLKEIATKKDIASFLKVPQSTLNSFLYKHSYEIKPIKLDREAIESIGSKSSRMNGYHINDVVKIVFGMDTEITASLKRNMFGDLATFAKMDSKSEITWREILRKVFAGFEMKTNHPIGKYRYFVDYFIPELMLCLEENGYDCHRHYDHEEEEKREQTITQKYALIRFHHKISLEVLFNAILKAKPGDIVKLYDVETPNTIEFSKN